MKYVKFAHYVSALALATVLLTAVASAKEAPLSPATTPATRPGDWWAQRQATLNARVKPGHGDLIFVGDSITQGWEDGGKDVWAKFYGKRNAVNLGIGGDETEHVLWRLDHGNVDGIKPKLAVVLIGTNNSGNGQSAAEVAAGVKAVVAKLREKLPQTKILLLAVFPRGSDNNDPIRKTNVKTNAIIANLADGQTVFFLDVGPKFLKADGTLSKSIMPDLLHPNAKGYQIWAETMEPVVVKLMGEK